MRLDKFLANMGVGTRTEVKQLLKKKQVTVNDDIETSPKRQLNPDVDVVKVNDTRIQYIDKVYLILNKPKGYISATEDDKQQTVIDLVDEYKYLNVFPVGRLDKDTEG
ncbi:MAG: S4 domain-containing protein, partial [Staphylococcus xylosus]|nr:S4 domain-containing protein [Staphylococcus xylosus]